VAGRRYREQIIEPLEPRSLLSAAWWQGFARDPQHTATSTVAARPITVIRWKAPVDESPQYSGNDLDAHYGSPLVTAAGTVIVPVKTGASGGFEVQARQVTDGTLNWTIGSDYLLPSHNWIPSFGPTLTPAGQLVLPAAGGTVLEISNADAATTPSPNRLAFYGISNYQSGTFNSSIFIDTPITADAAGNLYFGFLANGAQPPLGLRSGIARIDKSGAGTWTAAATAAADPAITEVAMNCAPALSLDGKTLYIAVSTGYQGSGYLLALDSTTLALKSRVLLKDPATGKNALLDDDSTASPTVGPDGNVYYGVLDNPVGFNHGRGWLLQFSGDLGTEKVPGGFGWDATPSIVLASMVPSYHGQSSYLLAVKYNNYKALGGDGVNKMAVLDPTASITDPVTGVHIMNPVLEIAGPTPDPEAGGNAVREWCINTAAVDPATDSILANSEDGSLYRWNLATNTLTQKIVLTAGIGEAYTPTVIANDGTVLAINNATLFAVGTIDHAPQAVDDTYNALESATLSVPVTLGVLSNDTDPDGDALRASLVSQPAHGSVTLNTDGSFSYTPNTGYAGQDAFTYKASDGTLDSNIATVHLDVLVGNDPPVAVNDSYTTTKGQTLEVVRPGVLGNDYDPDGDRIFSFVVGPPGHGSVSLSYDGSFSYTPSPDFSGVDSFQYQVSDGLSYSGAATVTLRVVDPSGPPAVTAQPVITQQGTALLGVVVGTILEGSPSQTSGSYSGTIDWGDGTMSAAVIAVVDNQLSNITGSHVYDVPGSYTITVTVQDKVRRASYNSTATVTVTPLGNALSGVFALAPGTATSASGLPITGANAPTIVGTAPPGWQVQAIVALRGVVGIATAGPDGRFQMATLPMADGTFSYSVMATNPAADALGSQLVLQAPVGALIIDTTPPQVKAVHLSRRAGAILITFVDQGSGLDLNSLLPASSYAVVLSTRRGQVLQIITGVLDLGPTPAPSTLQIALVLNGGGRLRGRRYLLTISSSLIRDLAGKALDGKYRGRLPSGNGGPGSDFVAWIDSGGQLTPLHGRAHRTTARHRH
jgi:hypothetical protein